MESWSYALGRRGVLLAKDKNLLVDDLAKLENCTWVGDMKHPYNIEVPNRQAIEAMEFMELGIPDIMRRSIPNHAGLGILCCEIGDDSSRKSAPSPSYRITLDSYSSQLESQSRLSSSISELNGQTSSLIDFKLGTDLREAKPCQLSTERAMMSSVGSLSPAKRTRATNLNSQTPLCQVYGCNKDLCSSKEYHKRHKVCEVHSKTAKVIVNGIEQRFCQQCSRFHLLAEFDDGKRSCRKRLAGHNERRRKPQLDTSSWKPQNLLQFYRDARSFGSSPAKKTSLVFPNILPGHQQGNWCSHIKSEQEQICDPQSAVHMTNGLPFPKPCVHLYGVGEQYFSGSSSSDTAYTLLDTASTVQEFSGVSNFSGALYLLSRDLSSHSRGMPMTNSQIVPLARAAHAMDQNSSKSLEMSILEDFAPNGFCSSRTNCMEAAPVCYPLFPGPTVDFASIVNALAKGRATEESMQVKQETDAFCCSSIT